MQADKSQIVILVLLLALAGFTWAKFIFAKKKLPGRLADIFVSGWEVIGLGIIIGPGGMGLVDQTMLVGMNPFLALVFGWAGLIFGIQLKDKELKKVEPALKKVILFEYMTTFIILFIASALLLLMAKSLSVFSLISACAIIALTGSISSPTILGLLSPRLPRSSNIHVRQLLVMTHLDLGPALLITGIVFLVTPPSLQFDLKQSALLLCYSVLIATAVAGILRFLERESLSEEENLTIFIGFLILISGIAFYLNLSPLFFSMIVGMVLANILDDNDPIFRLLFFTERPFYIILLLLAGLWFHNISYLAFVIALPLFALRIFAKKESVRKGARWFGMQHPPPDNAGMALAAQGALPLAIGLNYVIAYPGAEPGFVFCVILLMTVAGEVTAPFLILKIFGQDKKNRDGDLQK